MRHEILEEVWRVRDKISAECGHDLKKLVARLKRIESQYAAPVGAVASPSQAGGKQAM